jgi:N-acetylglucosamine-6-phosphate deacetylase
LSQWPAAIQAVDPSGAPGSLTFDHRILSFESRQHKVGEWVVPGFIDLQINGAYGIDVMSATPEELLEISRRLPIEGTTAWLPTVITAPFERIERAARAIAEAMAEQCERRRAVMAGSRTVGEAAILGMHLEGPFISPGRLGAHPALNLTPAAEPLRRVMGLKTLKLVTMAPELDHALAAIAALASRGIAVSIGHSDASYYQAIAGVEAGARMFTHVFNAMPPLHHRAPGAAGAALSESPAMAAVIPDGVHVHPSMLRLLWRARGEDSTILTTDRVAPAGLARDDDAGANSAMPKISDGAARLVGGTLVGSIITMLDGVRLMNEAAAIGVRGIASVASRNPARVLKLRDRGNLSRGSRADFLLINRQLELKAVFIDGREIG